MISGFAAFIAVSMETEWKPTTLHPLHDEFEATAPSPHTRITRFGRVAATCYRMFHTRSLWALDIEDGRSGATQ